MTTSDFPNTWYIACTCRDMKPHKKFVVNVVWLWLYTEAKIWIFDLPYMIQLVVSRKLLIFMERKLFGLVVYVISFHMVYIKRSFQCGWGQWLIDKQSTMFLKPSGYFFFFQILVISCHDIPPNVT